jgi:hypothetical protein
MDNSDLMTAPRRDNQGRQGGQCHRRRRRRDDLKWQSDYGRTCGGTGLRGFISSVVSDFTAEES